VSQTSFNCPYCWGDVPTQASVCGHCTRDLVLFKPLAIRLQTLADEVTQLKLLVEQQEQTLAHVQSQDFQTAVLNYAEAQDTPQALATDSVTATPSWGNWLGMVILTIALIGLCHWVLLFAYDAPPLFLRLLTITLPAITGYVCARRSALNWSMQLLAAVVVSTGSVIVMLGITAHIDGVPLWPGNPRDWRETFEYTAAICLGFFTGYLIYRLLARWKQKQRNKISLRILLARDENGKFKITEISNKVQSLITATAPLVSASMALYSGLKAFSNM
jgi:hypothetical protein